MDEIGKYEVDALREFTKSMKREGLSPAQCAIGSRIMKIFAGKATFMVPLTLAQHLLKM